MDNMNGWMWGVILVIGVVAVIKIITQVVHNSYKRNSQTDARHNTNVPVQSSNPIIASSNETGPMVYFANDNHHQKDNEYRFNYKKVSGSWRAYIVKMPSLGTRDKSGLVTHRKYDNGNPYVCWDQPINTLKDMQTISRVWADNIQEYIATGKKFG